MEKSGNDVTVSINHLYLHHDPERKQGIPEHIASPQRYICTGNWDTFHTYSNYTLRPIMLAFLYLVKFKHS